MPVSIDVCVWVLMTDQAVSGMSEKIQKLLNVMGEKKKKKDVYKLIHTF